MSENEDARGERKKASVWNSLEITKIMVGAATPFAIALLGIVVSASNAEQAKLTRTLDRRLETWTDVGPKIRRLKDEAASIYGNSNPSLPRNQRTENTGPKGVRDLTRSVDETLEVRPFFTPSVLQRYLNFSYCIGELVQSIEHNDRQGTMRPIARPHLKRLWEAAEERYRILVERVRTELSTQSPVQSGAVYPHRESLQPGNRLDEDSQCLSSQAQPTAGA